MANLIIIAAGNGKRMGDIAVPKALYEINGYPNLYNTIVKCDGLFDTIYLVIKSTAFKQFDEFCEKHKFNCILIPIDSGLGDGHALMSALDSIVEDESIVLWGDAYLQNNEIVKELLEIEYEDSSMIFPVNIEKNPYVTIITDENMNAIAADFSKLGENHKEGLHDQSIFKIKNGIILKTLINMHNVLWKNGRYISESKELNLLHALHLLSCGDYPAKAYISDYSVGCFNTCEEALNIEKTC